MYDFKKEMLEVLRKKAAKMGSDVRIAMEAPEKEKNPVILYSTGGYDEIEYSEAQHKMRGNYHVSKDGTITKYWQNDSYWTSSIIIEPETSVPAGAAAVIVKKDTQKQVAPDGVTWVKVKTASGMRNVSGVGHSNRSIGEFIALLKEKNIKCLVDVRSLPRSRFNPQFNRDALRTALKEQGIDYVWLGDRLGGKLPQYNDDFEAYVKAAPYDFKHGIRRLMKIIAATQGAVAICCSERAPDDCHRRFLLKYLEDNFSEDSSDESSGAEPEPSEPDGPDDPVVHATGIAEDDAGPGMPGYKENGEMLQEALNNYLDANTESLATVLREDTTPTLQRIPLEALEAIGTDNARIFLGALVKSSNVYIEIFSATRSGAVTDQTYNAYGIERREFSERRSRTNTLTLFLAGSAEELKSGTDLMVKIGDYNLDPKNTILMPVGSDKDGNCTDLSGLVRMTVLGLRLIKIARDKKAGKTDDDFIKETVNRFKALCEASATGNIDLTERDLLAIVEGTINDITKALRKIVSMLPTVPIDPTILQDLHRHAAKVLVAA